MLELKQKLGTQHLSRGGSEASSSNLRGLTPPQARLVEGEPEYTKEMAALLACPTPWPVTAQYGRKTKAMDWAVGRNKRQASGTQQLPHGHRKVSQCERQEWTCLPHQHV